MFGDIHIVKYNFNEVLLESLLISDISQYDRIMGVSSNANQITTSLGDSWRIAST